MEVVSYSDNESEWFVFAFDAWHASAHVDD